MSWTMCNVFVEASILQFSVTRCKVIIMSSYISAFSTHVFHNVIIYLVCIMIWVHNKIFQSNVHVHIPFPVYCFLSVCSWYFHPLHVIHLCLWFCLWCIFHEAVCIMFKSHVFNVPNKNLKKPNKIYVSWCLATCIIQMFFPIFLLDLKSMFIVITCVHIMHIILMDGTITNDCFMEYDIIL